MSIISVQNIHKYYGSFHALKGINLQFGQGEIFGLLGPNGAGKTTMIRILIGLIRPDQGEVTYFNQYGLSDLNKVVPQIGGIIEEPRFYKYLSARMNLKVSALYYPETISSSRIGEMMELVGLTERQHDRVSTYSQGMRQRLGIAQAMLHDPELIILDEPTNGLDPKGIIDLRQLILRLKNEFGKTVILSSHILSEVEQMADSMAIIHNGKCAAQGKVSELLNSDALTVTLRTGDDTKAVELLQNNVRELSTSNDGLLFSASRDELPEVVRLLTAAGIDIYKLDHQRKLEDYFLKLTNA